MLSARTKSRTGNFFRTTISILCFMTVSPSLPGLDPGEKPNCAVAGKPVCRACGGQVRLYADRKGANTLGKAQAQVSASFGDSFVARLSLARKVFL
jgi:hypothetical protein